MSPSAPASRCAAHQGESVVLPLTASRSTFWTGGRRWGQQHCQGAFTQRTVWTYDKYKHIKACTRATLPGGQTAQALLVQLRYLVYMTWFLCNQCQEKNGKQRRLRTSRLRAQDLQQKMLEKTGSL